MRNLFATFFLITGILIYSVQAQGAVEFFPISDLRSGMTGIGKTVIRGTTIEEFNVKIIDIVPDQGFNGGPLVIFEASGPVIDFSKGIAGGYSGSPVYIKGKLLGAVSAAFPYSDTHVGGLTPIQEMVKSLDSGQQEDYSKKTVISLNGKRYEGVYLASNFEEGKRLAENQSNRKLIGIPTASPLFIGGVSPSTFKILSKALSKYKYLEPMVAGGTGQLLRPTGDDNLNPGDALAVSLVTGDIEMYAVGTLTYKDDQGRVLAFGHPFFMTGNASLPMKKGYVVHTFTSNVRAFKLAVPLQKTLGTITKDKGAAVGGLLGKEPDLLPVSILVKDKDFERAREFKVKVVREPRFLLDSLVAGSAAEALFRVLDRELTGAMKLSFTIKSAALPESIVRVNYFYDEFDISRFLFSEISPFLAFLTTNVYKDVKVDSLEITMEVTRNRINASIDKAEIVEAKDLNKPLLKESGAEEKKEEIPSDKKEDGGGETGNKTQMPMDQPMDSGQQPPYPPPPPGEVKNVKPGETFMVKVRIQPYRLPSIERELQVTIPADFPMGPTSLIVGGGGNLISALNDYAGKGTLLFPMGIYEPPPDKPEDMYNFDALLSRLLKGKRNNELVVTLIAPYTPPKPPSGQEQAGPPGEHRDTDSQPTGEEPKEGETPKLPPQKMVTFSVETEYILYNSYTIQINITTEKKEEKPPETKGDGKKEGKKK